MTKKSLWWLEPIPRSARAITWSRRASAAFARPALMMGLLLAMAPVCVIMAPPAARAVAINTITVNSISDPEIGGVPVTSGNGFCTLREAINNANSPGTDTTGDDCGTGTGTDTINFSVSGTITLGLGGTLPAIVNTLTIDGSGETITIDGAGVYQVLFVNSGATLNLNQLTIADGNASIWRRRR